MENKPNLLDLYKRLLIQFSLKQKLKLILLIATMISSSFLEALSIGSIIPFITAMIDPNNLNKFSFLINFNQYISKDLNLHLQLVYTLIFIGLIISSTLFKILTIYYQTKFSFNLGKFISNKIYTKILHQPYEYHLKINSSDIISTIKEKSVHIVNKVVLPICNIISGLFLIFFIFFILSYINFKITFGIFIAVITFYLIIIFFIKKNLNKFSFIQSKLNVSLIKIIQESLKNIKIIIIKNSQSLLINSFNEANHQLREAEANIVILSTLPKYLLESILLVTGAILTFILYNNSINLLLYLPIITALVLSAQKLLPILNNIYGSISTILGNKHSFEDSLILLENKIEKKIYKSEEKILFNQKIEFKNISFRYNKKFIFKNLNLIFNKGENICILGETGSGKSTFINILIGLIDPDDGSILIDEQLLNQRNKIDWFNKISYLPQSIFLTNDSLEKNITLYETKNIDFTRINKILTLLNLNNINDNFNHKNEIQLGEDGSSISGGQKQRIGLARCLYENKDIIILDEATNSLDQEIEFDILSKILNDKANRYKTIILITHNKNLMDLFDKTFVVKNNNIKVISNEISK